MSLYIDCPTFLNDDEYMTPKSAWDDISEYLPRDKVIWECFYGDGSSGKHLRELGFQVIHEPIDFFTQNKGDILVSNPPYSKKRETFERLRKLDKPFVMLVPTTCLHTQYFKDTFGDTDDIQLIIPYRKRQFISPKRTLKPTGCSFYTLYVCYKMNLPKEIFFF